ncbi:phage tail assembly protein [Paenibacillus sp. GYB004]|uniref:phage tail assembly protein n=1 Tax=Paenibacillus sp. GYB004 TaxID=2994393 RepID=UPI002F96668A
MEEQQKNTNPGVVAEERIYKLARPFHFEGKQITELSLNLDDLTGQDLLLCARHAQTIDPNEVAHVKALSLPYQVAVAAKAAGVPAEQIKALGAKDFTQVTQRVQNFLIGQG